MKKYAFLLLLFLVFASCSLNNLSLKTKIGISFHLESRSLESTDVERLIVSVTGSDMDDLTSTSNNNTISIGVERGKDRVFTVELELVNGNSYIGTTTQNISGTSMNIDVDLLIVSEKDITSFEFTDVDSTSEINDIEIDIIVPIGTDLTNLIPCVIHTGASISPDTDVVTDFTSSVTYLVNAIDGTTKEYIVTVTAELNAENSITEFLIEDIDDAIIDISENEINILVPNGTDVTIIVPLITHDGASISPESGVATDFTSPVIYSVSSANGSTVEYTVTVLDKPTLEINITNNLESSISYSYSESLSPIVSGDVIDITPIIPMGQTIDSQKWYIDGVDIGVDTTSYTITHSDFNIGAHSISCVITSGNELFTLPLDFIIE